MFLGALLFFGCSPKPENASEPLHVNAEDVYRRVPEIETERIRIWTIHRAPLVGTFYVELLKALRWDFHPRSSRQIFMLAGRMKVRLGPQEKTVEPGDFLYIPPSKPSFRFVPVGRDNARFAVIIVPDADARDHAALEDDRNAP